MNTIDIDVGGTFTDLVLNFEGKTIHKKSPTTPYDLSVCFLGVIEEGAKEVDLELEEIFPKIELLRYSTTVAMNRLLEQKGPRLGLITTEGHEDATLIGKGAQWVDGTRVTERRRLSVQQKPEPLIPRENIVGVPERIDSFGNILRPLDEDVVRKQVHYLVDQGVRGFVVSLLWSSVNNTHEQAIKRIIREEYKEYCLGYLPVVLGSEVVGRSGEYQRTMTAILDAYLFRSMQIELSAMWDKIRDYGYSGPFLMVHNSGGMAEVFKTDAVRTYSAGPVAGLIGAHKMAGQLGYKNVVTSDVGGTSFDIGLVVQEGVRNYDFRPILHRWMIGASMIQTMSIGAGGGSIAHINELIGNLQVGPKSAGSYPGPVCYDQGNEEPTVTDANLVLGYLNPDYFFGGEMVLNEESAYDSIKTKVADPLGVPVHTAAYMIRQIADKSMGSAIRKEIHLRGYDPKEFVLFAIGGGGPVHVTGYMEDIPKALVFQSSPVFSALGSSLMDIKQVYERSKRYVLMEPGNKKFNTSYQEFNEIVKELQERAQKEMVTTGMGEAVYTLELDMLYGGQVHRKRTSAPLLYIQTEEDIRAIYNAFEREFSETFSPLCVHPEGGVYVESFIITATIPAIQKPILSYPVDGIDASSAYKATRKCYWGQEDYEDTAIYDYKAMQPGNKVFGPSILESEYITLVIPPEFSCEIDEHLFAHIERATA
ncbi:hydantoinase/oxoprolinase family protein [Desulfobacula sp.]|uniref:hydantoinase/oxoprolinase family protein n=1 Tax=Desulfobacula sp. TaxID=2593537 RepID=UPI0026026E8B|nr:hydantoinase/oxoprolinase family protein [Desulfobacula sp.]